MDSKNYEAFKASVAKASKDDCIWWEGYHWIQLTNAQYRDILDLLETKPFITPTKTVTNKDALMLPSGLCVHYD